MNKSILYFKGEKIGTLISYSLEESYTFICLKCNERISSKEYSEEKLCKRCLENENRS